MTVVDDRLDATFAAMKGGLAVPYTTRAGTSTCAARSTGTDGSGPMTPA